MKDFNKRVVLRYWDKTEAQVGDTVRVDESWEGIVAELIDTSEKTKTHGLDEYGILVTRSDGIPFFLPERFMTDFPVDLISRRPASMQS